MHQPEFSSSSHTHFAIGDVHGCASELRLLLNKLPLTKESTVVFLGELKKTCNVIALKGNHEDLLLSFLNAPESRKAVNFILNGGSATLASYSDSVGNWSIPPDHLSFFSNLELCYQWDSYVFVHANVPDIPYDCFVPAVSEDAILWSRQSFESRVHPWKKTVVHGHTPTKCAAVSDTAINLDTGCVYSHLLTAMEFPSRRVYSVSRMQKPQLVFLRDDDSRRKAARYQGRAPVYIDVGTVRLDFETVDYNEFGFMLRSCSFPAKAWLKENQVVQGYIGSDEHRLLKFDGVVLRADLADGEYRYAIRTTVPLQVADGEGFLPFALE
jgi:serine/threonine protein phosphatase 1